MALLKLENYYPNYRDVSPDMADVKNFDVYAQGDDKVGSVHDVLVDEQNGRFRYFVVDTGFWVFGKKVLLPVGLANIDSGAKRIYVNGLSKQQVEDLPNFNDLDKLDFDQEEQVRGVYRPMATAADTTAVAAAVPATGTAAVNPIANRDSYNYDQDASLYNLNDRNHQSLKLYEERLIADKHRQKTGEVAIGKTIETETARATVPIEKERVVIERTAPTGNVTDVRDDAFQEGEVVRMEVYEETPDIRKEAFVREEVRVQKVVERDTADVNETVRREELDVDANNPRIVDKDANNPRIVDK
jgi:uncharacterized protein (TIGR02271 family)